MNSPPGKSSPGNDAGAAKQTDQLPGRIVNFPAIASLDRQLQLLCIVARALVDFGCKLDDLVTLAQQQNDLLRRLVERSSR